MSKPPVSADYVSLQLALVDRFVELGIGSYASGVDQLTNLRRRLGLGAPSDPSWVRLLEQLDAYDDHASCVNAVMEVAVTTPSVEPEHIARGWPTSGAFSLDVRGAAAQTHFFSMDTDTTSPLARPKLPQRRRELASVIAHARREHPDLRLITRGSWLYSTTSYASLFPPEHLRTATVRRGRNTFQGMSHWGQFLDHRGALRTDLANDFRSRVATWSGDDPCLLFPIATLEVSSPIETFDPCADRGAEVGSDIFRP
ncbi:MAG: hypothetical protein AAGA42_11010 [Actinomycetota bacterium]